MPERTVQLSKEDAETLKAYAQEQGLTVDEVLQRFAASLRRTNVEDIHPEVRKITGLIPSDVDAKKAHAQHQRRKHGS
ncbi:DUF6364 family protein [Salinibacter altiplanensis]|uniref:DUF6364 family protein n=1 Tax=Salinibacter altiplanensis TaxID=1803181 RepID=UPI000C9FF637|nr:DUF6364 family protein [Salinibacter altiplanensis]